MGTSSMYNGPKDNKLLPDDYSADNEEGNKENPDENNDKQDPDAWKKTKNAMSKFIKAKNGNKIHSAGQPEGQTATSNAVD